MLRRSYDAVVIGAGPAGSMAAREIASGGGEVLLLEKHRRPGWPLCCAEAVPRASFERFIEPRPDWLCTSIERVKLTGPNDESVTVFHRDGGYILDRRKMDYDLAVGAAEAGAELACATVGLEVREEDGIFRRLEVISEDGRREEIEASVFVAADGVESTVARRAGLDNTVDLAEVESLLQYRLENISVAPDTIELHIGQEVAPGGYLWVFPKAADTVNVGLGIADEVKRHRLLEEHLEAFIDRRFPGGKVTEKVCGLAPKYQGTGRFRLRNLLVVGDAARALDSLSGAGIVNALMSGFYAGRAALSFIRGELEDSEEIEALYPGLFLKEKGEELSLYRKLNNVYKRLNDDDMIDIIVALREYFRARTAEGIKAGVLLAGLVKTRPRLLRLIRHLL